MCLAAHFTCCRRREDTWMVYCYCLPLLIPGKCFLNHFACSEASYHAKLWVYMTHDITTILLWSFSTIKLQAWVLATTVGFTKHLAKTQFFLTHNLLRACVSFLLSMRLTILCKNAKSFSNSIPVIYCWTGLLPKYPGYLSYVRIDSFLSTIFASKSWSPWNPFSFDRSHIGS